MAKVGEAARQCTACPKCAVGRCAEHAPEKRAFNAPPMATQVPRALPRATSAREDGKLLVDGAPAQSQLEKQAFLSALRADIEAAIEQELVGTGWTAESCPWLDYWFAYYEARSSKEVEAALHKYAPATTDARKAADYADPILARVQQAVRRWRTTGEIDAPEATMPAEIAVLSSLGPGRPLESGQRSRMERALGAPLHQTRVHTDTIAARESHRHGARAFAIGDHVAFGSGEFHPGDPIGDALLAHELAHTVQQRGAKAVGGGGGQLEAAADRSAAGTLARLWGGANTPATRGGASAGGLRLQRCAAAAAPAVATGGTAGLAWLGDAVLGIVIGGSITKLDGDTATTTTTTTTDTDATKEKEDPDAERKRNCYTQYQIDVADCGQLYTNDQIYDKCEKHAWQNYIRCINGAKRIPFPGH